MARKNATLVAGSRVHGPGRPLEHAGLSRTRRCRLLRAQAKQPQQALVLRLKPDDSGAHLVELDVEPQGVLRHRLIIARPRVQERAPRAHDTPPFRIPFAIRAGPNVGCGRGVRW